MNKILFFLICMIANANVIYSSQKNPFPNINITDKDQKTALWYAVRHNNKKVVENLLERNAKPDIPCDTPILHAAIKYSSKDICFLLLNNNANVNAVDHEGNTPLHVAISSYLNISPDEISKRLNVYEIYATLINTPNIDYSKANIHGQTPLILGTKMNETNFVEMLLKKA